MKTRDIRLEIKIWESILDCRVFPENFGFYLVKRCREDMLYLANGTYTARIGGYVYLR